MGTSNKYESSTSYMIAGLKRQPVHTGITIVFTIVSALLAAAPMVYIGFAIDELVISGLSNRFIQLSWMMVFLALIYLLLYFIQGYAWAGVVLRWERSARRPIR